MVYSDVEITIPHKDLLNRDFVLVPLSEIAPELIHPLVNKKISEIIILTMQTYIIRKIPHRVLI